MITRELSAKVTEEGRGRRIRKIGRSVVVIVTSPIT